jgi:hypothetical protein
MKNSNVGQIRVIEAVLALLIVFSAFTLSADLTATESTSRHGELASVGFQCLAAMDSSGSLVECIETADWARMFDSLELVLPVGLTFNMTVLDENLQCLNNVEISNGMLGNQEIASIAYVCASTNSSFRFYLLRLQLAVIA